VRIWHQFVHQANAISLCGINDVAGEDDPVWNTTSCSQTLRYQGWIALFYTQTMVPKSDASGSANAMRPPLTSRKESRP
jgi:hypothetical protein